MTTTLHKERMLQDRIEQVQNWIEQYEAQILGLQNSITSCEEALVAAEEEWLALGHICSCGLFGVPCSHEEETA